MYEKFYGLNEPPFQLTPDPRFLYMSSSHQEAYAQLALGLRMRRGFIVLSGEVGTGKTTLIRAIMQELDSDTQVALIFHTLLSARGLLQNICNEFGINTEGLSEKSDYILRLHEFLTDLYGRGGNAVLIIDEAHNLKEDVLEEIRLLSNLETPDSKLIQICLVGQPELLETLARPQLRQLNQRISLRFRLTNLNAEETSEYIRHRLNVAGLQILGELFTRDAMHQVYEATRGVPRKINILCENALVMGYVKGVKQIGPAIVEAVTHEDTYHEFETVLAKAQSLSQKDIQLQETPVAEKAATAFQPPGEPEAPPVQDSFPDDWIEPPGKVGNPNGKLKEAIQDEENPVTDWATSDQAGDSTLYRHSFEGQARKPINTLNPEPMADQQFADDANKQPEQQKGQDMQALSRTLINQLMREFEELMVLKKPSGALITALFLIAFLSYIIAILSAIFLLKYLDFL